LEVEHALASGKPVYELVRNGVTRISEPPVYVSIDETFQLYDEWEYEHFDELEVVIWRREWDSNPRGPNGPQALKANAPQEENCASRPTRTG
jgi:hypothetical protein